MYVGTSEPLLQPGHHEISRHRIHFRVGPWQYAPLLLHTTRKWRCSRSRGRLAHRRISARQVWRDEGKRENLRKPVSKAAAAKQAMALRLQGPDGSEGCSESESSEGEDPTQLVVGTSEGFESDALHDLCTENQGLAVPETQEQDLTAQEATELDSLDWNSELPSDDDATQLEVPLRSGRGTSKRAVGDVGEGKEGRRHEESGAFHAGDPADREDSGPPEEPHVRQGRSRRLKRKK